MPVKKFLRLVACLIDIRYFNGNGNFYPPPHKWCNETLFNVKTLEKVYLSFSKNHINDTHSFRFADKYILWMYLKSQSNEHSFKNLRNTFDSIYTSTLGYSM